LHNEHLPILRQCPRPWRYGATAAAIIGAASLSLVTLQPASRAETKQSLADVPRPIPAPPSWLALALKRDASGEVQVYLNDEKTTEVDIRKQLHEHPPAGDQTFALSAEKGISYGRVMAIVDLLESCGVKKLALDTNATSARSAKVIGQVTGKDGKPIAGAHVAAIYSDRRPRRGGDLGPGSTLLAEAESDAAGRFEIPLSEEMAQLEGQVLVVARADQVALAWKHLNLDALGSDVTLVCEPEVPIRVRLVDLDGGPANGVTLQFTGLMSTPVGPNPDYAEFDDTAHHPTAWPPAYVTDSDGRSTIYGLASTQAATLKVVGDDRFAPQDITLNSGEPEERGPHDATYRPIFKNVRHDEEAVITLSAAKIFEGTVRYADTNEPAPQARLTIWASQQKNGSMYSVGGIAGADGHYHIVPMPGIRFGVTAYPPDGAPYLATAGDEIKWDDADRVKTVDLLLDRGVLVRGKVTEKESGAPIAGASVQYVPRESTASKLRKHISGWEGIQTTNDDGRFEIVVLPGRGTLFVHGPRNEYVIVETTSNEIDKDRPGGVRQYAHAIQAIQPTLDKSPLDVSIELSRGAKVHGTLVDEAGQSVDQAILISWRNIHPYWLQWWGTTEKITAGQFEIGGLVPGETYEVHFLDAQQRSGATAMIRADDPSPRVVMQHCGTATIRAVDSKGKPVPNAPFSVHLIARPGVDKNDWLKQRAGLVAADMDFIQNIDRVNYPRSETSGSTDADDQGRLTLPALIPGATYAIEVTYQGNLAIGRLFEAEAAKTVDLGDIEVDGKNH
jgi:biopolymer transport protein ExbD